MHVQSNSFLHVGLTFAGTPRVRDLEPLIQTLCNDWVRYSANNWIIWSNRTPVDVADALRAYLDEQDLILVVRLDTHGVAGFLPQWIWDWINRPRPPGWRPPPRPLVTPPQPASGLPGLFAPIHLPGLDKPK